ncbi:MAG: hypothetical protein D6768_06110 [Chloroflexi bacterium]|nr:MAG: hypothetical protein D6768_06110 [Chloroflexota bacterium]
MHSSVKHLAAAAGLLVAAGYLAVSQPIWLAPPWITWTPIVYVVLLLLWLPFFLRGMWLLFAGRKQLFTAIIALTLTGQCCLILTLNPAEFGQLGIYGGQHPVLGGYFFCQETTPTTLTCELCIISSDNPPQISRTYNFSRVGGLPLLRLSGTDTQIRAPGGPPVCRR